MAYDFWNNPLVVSAFRRKYRRSGPSQTLILYPMALLLVGMGVTYFMPEARREWPRVGFIALMAVQTMVSGLAAAVGTASSMKSEVAKQTLDFQRLSSLSPRQILLGKLLGESAMAFLLAMSVFPLAFFCWINAGFGTELFVLAFVNLAGHIALSGSTGLVQPLEQRDGKQSEGVLWLVSVPIGIPALSVLGMALFNAPAYSYPVLLAWLCFIPTAQVVLAVVSFHIMERRLENPLNPAISKPLSYALLPLVDLTAVVFLHQGPSSFGQRWAILTIIHLVAVSVMISGVTPVRETCRSWVWRFRGRVPRVLDSLLGNRAENGMAVVVYALYGVVMLLAEFGVSYALGDRDEIDAEGITPLVIGAVMVLLVLVQGTTYQFLMFQLGRKGASAYSGLVFLLVFVPLMAAGMIDAMAGLRRLPEQHEPLSQWLLSITPAAHFVHWLGRTNEQISLVPMVVLYVAVLLLFWIALRGSMRALEAQVDAKLRSMGVPPPGR